MQRSRTRRPALVGLALVGLFLGGCPGKESATNEGGATMTLSVTSPAFQEGDAIPKKYTADGSNVSPPLQWGEPPPRTASLALITDDPDAPDPDAPRRTWVHWVVYDIPASERGLSEGVPAQETLANGTKQGKNDFGNIGYGGPDPPSKKPHRYFFKLYALDSQPALPPGATKAQLEAAMRNHILAQGQLMGKYGR